MKDIEDLPQKCPKTGSSCSGLCQKSMGALRIDFGEEKHWHKVTSIKGIFDVLEEAGDAPYMFVAGNTAHGKRNGTKLRNLSTLMINIATTRSLSSR